MQPDIVTGSQLYNLVKSAILALLGAPVDLEIRRMAFSNLEASYVRYFAVHPRDLS